MGFIFIQQMVVNLNTLIKIVVFNWDTLQLAKCPLGERAADFLKDSSKKRVSRVVPRKLLKVIAAETALGERSRRLRLNVIAAQASETAQVPQAREKRDQSGPSTNTRAQTEQASGSGPSTSG
jgi:hypothetical protein